MVLGGEGGGDAVPGGVVGEDERRAGVAEHVGDPVGRVSGVDGQVGGARLEDGPQCDDQVGGAGQCEGDGPLGARAVRDEQPGQAVGSAVEGAVGEDVIAVLDGDRVGVPVGGLPEEGGQREQRAVVGGVVPFVQDLGAFAGFEQVEPADRGVLGACQEASTRRTRAPTASAASVSRTSGRWLSSRARVAPAWTISPSG